MSKLFSVLPWWAWGGLAVGALVIFKKTTQPAEGTSSRETFPSVDVPAFVSAQAPRVPEYSTASVEAVRVAPPTDSSLNSSYTSAPAIAPPPTPPPAAPPVVVSPPPPAPIAVPSAPPTAVPLVLQAPSSALYISAPRTTTTTTTTRVR